jgi:choline dehydrogenase-like flavoprotein
METPPLTYRQLQALRAVCDTFAPAIDVPDDRDGFWARRADDLDVAGAITELLVTLPAPQQREFRRLLDLLASPILGITWRGPLTPAARLAPEQREVMLQRWSRHFVPQLRKGFTTLKKLSGMLYYALVDEDGRNPNWPAIGYPGPEVLPATAPARPLRPLQPDRDLTLTCDTVIVGSGAGGGVVAGELAASGEDVIIIEKGPYVPRDRFEGLEGPAMRDMYERRGALVTADGGVSILAGSCLGGGTTVNWAGAFRTPHHVLHQWATDHDLPHLISTEFARSFGAVEAALDVGTDRGAHNPQNLALRRGCEARGLATEDIPRNMRQPGSDAEWRAVGFSPFGDRLGTKRGMVETYLEQAFASGARLLPDTEVERVIVQHGRAAGVEAIATGPAGERYRVTVRARRVVVAAGAIHTPALLARSGVEHQHLGHNLYLHPTVAVAARYPEVMDPWHGPMMSVVCSAFARLADGYGFRLETPPVHPGLLGLALPWAGGRQHKEAMADARHVGATIVLTRDRDGGRVATDAAGRPVPHYRLSAFDRQHVLRGIEEAARVHLAAGAEAVHFPHNRAPVLRRDEDAEALFAGMPGWRWTPNRFPLFSAHQMGSCRMGGTASRAPVAPDGAVRGVAGLYVADASLFPESSGANPMLSVQALAHYIAQGLKASGSGNARRVGHASAA